MSDKEEAAEKKEQAEEQKETENQSEEQKEIETQSEEGKTEEAKDETAKEDSAEKTEEELVDAAEDKAAQEQAAEVKPVVQVPLAPRCENPIIGRKIFFVNPPLYVENYLQPALKLNEYEAYIIKDYKYTKNALKMFPDALCFIFIDDEMSYDGWFNYILSFQKDEKLKTIFVGLMSAMIPAPKREKFMMNLSLPGGFLMLNEIKGSALIDNVIGILELNGAKGKRKYIRLDCDENIKINGYFANQTQLLQVTIANISSVGFTCYFPRSYGAVLAKKMVVPSFSITLGRRSVATPALVFDVKAVDENNYFAVALFLKQVGQEERKVIKNFIFEQLEERFNKVLYANQPDIEDYFGSSEPAEEIEEAEEVSEESEKKEVDKKEDGKKEEKKEEAAKDETAKDEKAESAEAEKAEDKKEEPKEEDKKEDPEKPAEE